MNFFKIIILFLLINLATLTNLYAVDETENEQNIVEKAKEINKKIKEKQANQENNISSEVSEEEPLPLNDPFAGDASLAGMGSSNVAGREDIDNEMSLYNFKLVGIMTGEYVSYVSLINAAGEIVTLEMHEELSEGVKLVSLKPSEAIFQKEDETFLKINFKNQIKEVKEVN